MLEALEGGFNLQKMREDLELAEALAQAKRLTSPAARRRLAARSVEMKFGYIDEDSGDFVPPRQLLIYLVRMGSFSSVPKIMNEDCQDNDLRLPQNITRNELLRLCKNQPIIHPMVKRNFKKNRHYDPETGLKLIRRWNNHVSNNTVDLDNASEDEDVNKLRVLQWNVLSQALGKWHDNFAKCPDEALEWNARKYLIIEEIVEYNPDVICLQEVDHFNFLSHVLSTQGYTGMFFPKPDSPCFYLEDNNGPDGCAIFYKTDKFELIQADTRILEIWRVQSNQVALLMVLKVKKTGQEICVTTTHLKAKKGALLSTLRNEQGKDLLKFVNSYAEGRPVVLCGDFNAEPIEPVYSTICRSNMGISSAYADCDNSDSDTNICDREPAYTTWKIREEGEICHTIDYIFYSKDRLEVEAVLELPTEDEIGENRIPSLAYPSDHFSLVCDLRIVSRD